MSTAVELAGFGCVTAAAWLFGPIPGLLATGVVLLLIGYAMDDAAVAVSLRRVTTPWRARATARKAARVARKAAKQGAKQS